MATAFADSMADFSRERRIQLARQIEKAYAQSRLHVGSQIHALAVKVHHALIGQHDLLTDMELHLGEEEFTNRVEVAKRLMLSVSADFRRLVLWLASHGGVQNG